MKKKILMTLTIILFIAGLLVLLYPFISNWTFAKSMVTKIEHHELKYNGMTIEEIDKEILRAKTYNDALREGQKNISASGEMKESILDEYEDILNIDSIICLLEIPKINVKLPVYHGVSEEVLGKGIGHISETSFPIGGAGTHSFLTGHTGLASADLFSDLDKLQIRDKFFIYVLDERLAYSVDKINVVAAEEFSEVEITENGDFITLVTCTPIGINSHRLLVRGERIHDVPVFPDEELSVTESIDLMIVSLVIIIICILLLIIFIRKWYLAHIGKKRKERCKM